MPVRILVVEDDPQMREVLVSTLEEEGYDLQGAASADVALELAQTATFALSVTDVRLPGMDGLDYLLEMRARQPSMRAIVITGYAQADAPSRAILAQADDYIYKPFSLGTLLSSVSRALNPPHPGITRLPERLCPKAGWIELSRRRDRVFRGFFVGLRSALLDEILAWRLWNQLEALEAAREDLWRRLEAGEDPDCSAALGGYEALLRTLIGSVAVGQARQQRELGESLAEIVQARSSQGMERRTFERLHRRVRAGVLAPEMLMAAFRLHQLSPPELRGFPELQELYWSVLES